MDDATPEFSMGESTILEDINPPWIVWNRDTGIVTVAATKEYAADFAKRKAAAAPGCRIYVLKAIGMARARKLNGKLDIETFSYLPK